jgi:hypothetical protein
MDFTVYLPDSLGDRVREADLPRGLLSALFREAVEAELERRMRVAATLKEPQEFKFELEDDQGYPYIGVVNGVELAYDERDDVLYYLTADERVIAVDRGRSRSWEVEDPQDELFETVPVEEYYAAMQKLGLKPKLEEREL